VEKVVHTAFVLAKRKAMSKYNLGVNLFKINDESKIIK